MSTIKVTLHTPAYIKANLLSELSDGSKHTNRIAFNESVLDKIPNDSVVTGLTPYPPTAPKYYAMKVTKRDGNMTNIHPSWIKSINGLEISIEKDNIRWGDGRKNQLQLNSKYILSMASGLKLIADMPTCSCGAPNVVYESNGIRLCQKCVDESTKINSYSYRPTPSFIGSQITADVDNPVWFGIELEYGFKSRDTCNNLLLKHSKTIYAKNDSSIRGGSYKAEIVSHPHSYTSLMAEGSFINSLADISVSDNSETRESNGCHVHISRTSFVDDKHYAKWYFLIHQMKDINEFIGGRRLTRFCKFSPNGKIHNKGNKVGGDDRSLMINERNTATVEARFFTGTKNVNQVKVYVQYLESLIKYTKYAGDTVGVNEWLTYIKRKSSKYALLIAKMETNPHSTSAIVEYRQPIKSMSQWEAMTVGDISNITKVKINGTWHVMENCYINNRELWGKDELGGSIFYQLTDIQEVEISK